MKCVTRTFYLETHPIVALHDQVKRPIFLALVCTSMVSNVNVKTFNNSFRCTSARIRDFRGATIKHLKHHVLPSLADDTPDIAVI